MYYLPPPDVTIRQRIDVHRRFFEQEEKAKFEKSRLYYQGDFLALRTKANAKNTSDPKIVYHTTKNLIFPLVDTALSAIVGSNPSVSALTLDGQINEQALIATANMQEVWRLNDMLRVCRVGFSDALLFGRNTFKAGYCQKRDLPIASTVDVDAFFFDLETKYQDKIRYKLEATPMPLERFFRRYRDGMYPLLSPADAETIEGSAKPVWMGMESSARQSNRRSLADVDKWVIVWEYYDLEDGCVYHYLDKEQKLLLKDTLRTDPYVMYEMNYNGEDCRGLSEALLIQAQQETTNDLLTFWKNVVYLIVPRILYNAGLIRSDDLNSVVSSVIGSFVPIHSNTEGLPPQEWAKAFYPSPTITVPPEAVQFLDRQEADAGYISAIADLSRGQVSGAKTATEVAVMDQFNRNRTSSREGNFYDALAKLAEKMSDLDRRKMAGARTVSITQGGKTQAVKVDLEVLQAMPEMRWKWTAYNPIKNNPMVLADMLQKIMPAVLQSPIHDQRKFWMYLQDTIGAPQDLLKSEEQIKEEEQKAQAAAAPPQAPPGGEQIPPEVMAQLAAEQQGQTPGGLPIEQQVPAGQPMPIPPSVMAEAGLPGQVPLPTEGAI